MKQPPYARELVMTYRPSPVRHPSTPLNSPQVAASVLTKLLSTEPVEVAIALYVDAQHQLLAWHEVSRGTLTGTFVEPREVFAPALACRAAGVIVAHNHPSGDTTPSPDDRAVTRRLTAAGELLGVELLDHFIVGHDDRYYSFRQSPEGLR